MRHNPTFARMITIGKCLEWMHSGKPFSLKVVSYDSRRPKKSGRVLEYQEAVLMWGDGGSDRAASASERQPTDLERALMGALGTPDKRNPNHSEWYTRNIRILQHGEPTAMLVKIHPPLIIQFNGETTCP